ncbi:MAG: tyrosine-type recombinase/integrase [Candidatus Latescibacterota bacterium]|nr:tyrosine-type recombinase/integrase [Candidatus Latescibacterota bacterium]
MDELLSALETQLSNATLSAYRTDLSRYATFLREAGVSRADEITVDHPRRLLEQLSQRGLSAVTIARNASSLRRFHQYLVQCGHCQTDMTAELQTESLDAPLSDTLTTEQAAALVTAISGDSPLQLRNRALLELLYAAALRVSEIVTLEVGDLRLQEGLLRVGEHGKVAERILPLGDPACRACERYLESGRRQLVGDDSGDVLLLSVRGRQLSRMSVWKVIRDAASAARINRPVNARTVRNSCAAHLLRGGATLQDVQVILGHANIASTHALGAAFAQVDITALHQTHHPRH